MQPTRNSKNILLGISYSVPLGIACYVTRYKNTTQYHSNITVRPTIWQHLFFEFWLVLVAHWRHQRAETRLENVRQFAGQKPWFPIIREVATWFFISRVGNKNNRVKGQGKIYANDVLKSKFITWIIEKNKVHPTGNRQICVEVIKIKFNVEVTFKVQRQLFADVLQNKRS